MRNAASERLGATTMDSPVGVLTLVASERGLRAVLFESGHAGRVVVGESDDANDPDAEVPRILAAAKRQLAEYFDGTRRDFDLPLDPVGTEFQQRAWQLLRTIPYGATISYGEQAVRLGARNKARAVGAANGRNPLSIIVPCHRVVGSTGRLTGFGGGLDRKAWLLQHEQGGCLDLR